MARRRKGRSRSRGRRCHRPGPVTRSAFFNFLRVFRRKSCGKTIIEIAKAGAREWHRMSEQQKCKFMQQAYCVSRKGRRHSRRRR